MASMAEDPSVGGSGIDLRDAGISAEIAAPQQDGDVQRRRLPIRQNGKGQLGTKAVQAVDRKNSACTHCPMGKAGSLAPGGRCIMVSRVRAAGTWLYAEGDTIDRISYIRYGLVVLSRDAGDRHGRGTAWAVRRTGSLLGIEGLVRSTYLDCARAVTDINLCSASRDEMKAWIDAQGSAARTVLDLVLLAQAHDSPRRAGSDGNAMRRVALWLLDEENPGAASNLPRNVIAELLGMLPETFSRALSGLVTRGAIKATRRTIQILSVEILEEIAGTLEDVR